MTESDKEDKSRESRPVQQIHKSRLGLHEIPQPETIDRVAPVDYLMPMNQQVEGSMDNLTGLPRLSENLNLPTTGTERVLNSERPKSFRLIDQPNSHDDHRHRVCLRDTTPGQATKHKISSASSNRRAWIFISRLEVIVTDIKEHSGKYMDEGEEVLCEEVRTRYPDYRSFQAYNPLTKDYIAIDPKNWPMGVLICNFRLLRRDTSQMSSVNFVKLIRIL